MKTLVIDDDAICRNLLVSVLRPYGSVDEAVDGLDAIRKIGKSLREGQPYDLLTLDIMMPDMSGHAVLVALHEMQSLRDIPVGRGAKIFMTSALDDSGNVLGAFRESATAYLTKPIDLTKLTDLCREHDLIA